jgi:hypothetical protein
MAQFNLSTKKEWKKARSIFSSFLRKNQISNETRSEIKSCWHFANSMSKGHIWVLTQRGFNCPFPDFVRETADRLRLSAGLKPVFGAFSPETKTSGKYWSSNNPAILQDYRGEHSSWSPMVRPEKRLTMNDIAMHYVLTGRI